MVNVGAYKLRPQDILNSGLNSTRKELDVVSQNMANADLVENGSYAARKRYVTETLTANTPSGTTASEIHTALQQETVNAIRNSLSDLQQSIVKGDFYSNYEVIVGESGRAATFVHSGSQVFETLNQLTGMVNGTNSQMLMSKIDAHITDLKQLYSNIQEMRFNADGKIEQAVSSVNLLLTRIATANKNISKSSGNTDQQMNWVDDQRAALQQLSECVGIRTSRDSNGIISVYTIDSGRALVQGVDAAKISYTRATTVTPTTTFSNITLSDQNGNSSTDITALLRGNGNINNNPEYGGGELRALLEIRDIDLVTLQQRLDKYAETLRDNINKYHNQGATKYARTTLTGTAGLPGTGGTITGATVIAGQGTFRIAVVDTTNNQATAAFSDINLVGITNITGLMTAINAVAGVNASINANNQLEIAYTGGVANRGISIGETGATAPQICLDPASTGFAAVVGADPTAAHSVGGFFGLNNVFDSPNFYFGAASINGLVSDLSIRSDLKANPNLFCIGKLNTDAAPPFAAGQVATPVNDATVANSILNFYNNTTFTFTTASGAQVTGTPLEFAERIIADQAAVIATNESAREMKEYIHKGLAEAYNKQAGVDREEAMQELMHIVIQQKMIGTALGKVNEMQKQLIESLR